MEPTGRFMKSQSPRPSYHFRDSCRPLMQSRARLTAFAALLLAISLGTPVLPANEPIHNWDVIAHYLMPDGSEKTVHVEDFRFVYYERHYVHLPKKSGAPQPVRTRDVPKEVMSLQNEKLDTLRFWKLSNVKLEYRSESGKRELCLVITLLSPADAFIVWPVSTLRNVSDAPIPHFRGRVDGKEIDIPLPLEEEGAPVKNGILTSIDFRFPGQEKHRTWL